MYFQSPRPFGQQSTSFRPVGNGAGGLRGASSLSVLSVSTFDNTGFVGMPVENFNGDDFCNSIYDSSINFATSKNSRKNSNHFNETNGAYDLRKSKISSSIEYGLDNSLRNADNVYGRTEEHDQSLLRGCMSKPKHSLPRKTTSLTDALSDDTLNPSFSGWESNVRREVPILREPASWLSCGEKNSDFQHSDFVRCMSEAPSDRRFSKPGAFDGLLNNSANKKTNVTQLSADLEKDSAFSKAIDESRFGKNSNFGTFVKMMKSRPPGQVSTDIMLNAAIGVKAELEKDPKFRSRANNLKNNRFPVKSVHSGNYKQSPTFKHLEGFLLNSPSILQPPLVSSTFTPEKVHDLFSPSSNIPLAIVPPAVQNVFHEDNTSSDVLEKFDTQFTVNKEQRGNVGTLPVKIVMEKDFKPDVKKKLFYSNNQSESNVRGYQALTRNQKQDDFKPVMEVENLALDNSQVSSTRNSLSLKDLDAPVDSSVFTNTNDSELSHQGSIPISVVPSSMSNPPTSILVKTSSNYSSEIMTKPVKKVVFQCDDKPAFTLQTNESFVGNGKNIPAQDTPFCITQYDEAVGEKLREFVKLGHQISGDLDEAVEIVACAFSEMRKFIWDASGQAELTGNGLSEKLSPISQNVEKMGAYASSHRTSKLFNHLSALAGGVPALGWLAVKKTPGPHIKEMRDAALFYINRIYKEYKDGDKTHTEWAKSWVELLSSLEKYVRQVHTTGLVWNSAPGSVSPDSGTSVTQPVQSAPPPVPFIPEGLLKFDAPSQDTGGDRSALFAEINKGSDITKGLKKVTKDMMTHKNPALRAQGPLEPSKPNIAKKTAPKKDTEPERPPKLVLENGKQWNVEYYKGKQDLVVEITDMKQTVYIYKCEGCLIQINGKVNSVTLDGCKKTSVVFGNLLSQIEVINCQSVQIQSTGTMPTVSIQKTDGCQVYLNKDSLNAEIVASKSSTMNVLVPVKEDGDYQEFPVPEQFKTVFDGSKLVTTVSDIV